MAYPNIPFPEAWTGRDNFGNVLEGNRYYWKIPCWPIIEIEETSNEFELHGKKWSYSAIFRYDCLRIRISSLEHRTEWSLFVSGLYEGGSERHLFEMDAGVVGEGRREVVVAVKDIAFSETYKLMRRSAFDSALQNNREVFLFVEMRKKTENAHRIKTCRPKIEIDFTEMLLSGKYCDVTLEVQGRKFNCHRSIIGARSPVLAAMFEHDMREKSSGVVSIGDAEPGAFQEFLLYLYSANDDQLSLDNTAELYKLGDKYGVEDLKNVCREEMQENIDKENFFEVFRLSQLYSDSALTEKSMEFFLRDPQEIIGGECWDTFSSENPVESAILIKALDDEAKKL